MTDLQREIKATRNLLDGLSERMVRICSRLEGQIAEEEHDYVDAGTTDLGIVADQINSASLKLKRLKSELDAQETAVVEAGTTMIALNNILVDHDSFGSPSIEVDDLVEVVHAEPSEFVDGATILTVKNLSQALGRVKTHRLTVIDNHIRNLFHIE